MGSPVTLRGRIFSQFQGKVIGEIAIFDLIAGWVLRRNSVNRLGMLWKIPSSSIGALRAVARIKIKMW